MTHRPPTDPAQSLALKLAVCGMLMALATSFHRADLPTALLVPLLAVLALGGYSAFLFLARAGWIALGLLYVPSSASAQPACRVDKQPCVEAGKIVSSQTACCCETPVRLVPTSEGTGWRCRATTATTIPTSTATTTTVRPTTTTATTATTTTRPAPSTTSTTLPTITRSRFAAGAEVNALLPVDQQCAWFGGITADQTERALLYLKGHRLMVEGLLLAKQMPGCADLLDGPDASHLEIEDSRLRVFYVDPKRNSVWALLRRCADYGHVSDAGKRLRKCILAKPANQQACAAQLASPLFAPVAADLRGWLHLTDSCAANPAPVTWPRTKPDTDRRAEGTLNYSLGLPETTAAHKAAVRNLVATHHAVDHAYIHGGPAPAPGSVQRAVLAAMDAAPTEEWRHATIMEFTTLIDPAWAEDERKDWKRLEGLAMAFWGRGFEELPGEEVWKFLTPTRATHETIHRCAALKNGTKVAINDHVAELKRLGDLSATAKETQLSSQPRRTCAAWLACLRDRSCALPWVPADWRAM